MRIPIITAEEPYPIIKPTPKGTVWEGIGAAAEGIQGLISKVTDQYAEIEKKKQLLAMESDIGLAEGDLLKANNEFVFESRKTADPKTYLQNWEKWWDEAVKNKISQAKDPETKARMGIRLNRNKINEFEKERNYADSLWINTERGKRGKILEDYASMGKLQEGLDLIEKSKDIYNPVEIENLKSKLEEEFQKSELISKVDSNSIPLIEEGIKGIDQGKYNRVSRVVQAQMRTNALDKIERLKKEIKAENDQKKSTEIYHKVKKDSLGVYELMYRFLKDEDYLKENDIDLKTKGEVEIRLKTEQSLKEQEIKTIRDKEEKDFAKQIVAGTLTLQNINASSLTGDDIFKWQERLEKSLKVKDEDIDPAIEAINYSFINELISKEVDPKSIKGHIFDSELKSGTKQKLLDRLDTETDKAINKSRTRAYEYMKSQIMPYGGMLAAVPPLQAANYTKAMNALDDWIDKQRKVDKPITSKDIQAKAEELAITFETTISERQEIKAKEDKEYLEGLIKKEEKKIEPKTEIKKSEIPIPITLPTKTKKSVRDRISELILINTSDEEIIKVIQKEYTPDELMKQGIK